MRIFKYLKGHTAAVLVVLVLLVGEAFCDLALPTYTGNIVNVGIQQSGIENASPDVMTARTFDDVAMLMSADDENLLRASYTLGDDGLYRLNDTGKADRTALDSAIALPLVVADRGQLAESSDDAASAATEAPGVADAADSDTASAPRAEAAAGAPVSLDQSAADDAAGASAEDAESAAATASAAADMSAASASAATLGSAQSPSLAALESAYAQGLISKDQIADLLSQVTASLGGSDDLIAQQAVASAGSELERAGVDLASVQMSYLLRTGLTMMGFVLASAVLASVMGLLASRVGAGVGRELRGKLYRRVMAFSDAEVQKFSAASLITRATNDVQQIQNMTVMLLRMMLYAPILAAGGVIMIVRTDLSMAWVVLVGIVAVFAVVGVLMKLAMPKFRIMQKLIDRVNLIAREMLTGVQVVRAFGRQDREQERFDDASRTLMGTQLFTNRVMTFMMPSMMLIMNGLSVLIVWVGAGYVDAGTMQTGDLIAFITYAMMIVMSFLMIGMLAVIIPRADVSAGRIDEVLETEPSIVDGAASSSSGAGELACTARTGAASSDANPHGSTPSHEDLALTGESPASAPAGASGLASAATSTATPARAASTQAAFAAHADLSRNPGATIAFDHVRFKYHDSKDYVLKDVTFTAEAGQTVAIIGSTGSGKSTVMKLIERFYDVTDGAVTIDGVDVRALPQHELRAQLGYVPQQAFLFSGTIASNIGYGADAADAAAGTASPIDDAAPAGKPASPGSAAASAEPAAATATAGAPAAPDAAASDVLSGTIAWDRLPASDRTRIKRAAAIAQASSFIAEKEHGFDDPISQGGTNVSGGQRQRLAIARALATDARAYLFDDSFSALDYKTDAALRHDLATKMADRTVIVVAQRIASVMDADKIIVLDEGRVVGEGTHAELLETCPTYQEIALSQLSEEELKGGDAA
ncbi:MAG: ABC transporter ATP-binding protein [Eggerthellaceae bacterium]